MLRYSAHELAYDISYKALELIKNKGVYNILIAVLPKQYVNLYYMKMIYEAFLPIAHQLVIYRHDEKNLGKVLVNSIEADGFPCQTLLMEILKACEIDLFLFDLIETKKEIENHPNPKAMLRKMLKSLLHTFISQSNNINPSSAQNVFIGLNYFEGFDINKRSDFFWFIDSGIDPSLVTVYYESPTMMTRHDNDQTAEEFFHENGIRQVKLWEWKPSTVNEYFMDLEIKLRSLYPSDEVDKWLKRSALYLCNRSSFWASFFDYYGIKIHLDSTMSGLDSINKQIAIKKLGGCSIGKLRSYPTNLKGSFLGFYPNDVFFNWGRDSALRIHESQKHINNILVSGFTYKSTSLKHKNKVPKKNIKFESKKTKFNILLLDNNHGPNNKLAQSIETSVMVTFYQTFLDWIKDDKNVGLVIKPKKPHILDALPDIINQIREIEITTGRCELIRNSFQKMANTYLNGIDIVVGTSEFYPSSIIECVIHGAKAVFYDYANLRYHEHGLYKWGENKVVFSNLSEMFDAVKSYKNDPLSNPTLGEWSEHLDELDHFRDGKGGERIGTYMRWLQEGFFEGLDSESAINYANKLYQMAWGNDALPVDLKEA